MDVRERISGMVVGQTGRLSLGSPRLERRHLLALGGALLVQFALLGPMIWSGLGGDAVFQPALNDQEAWVLPLDLTPRRARQLPTPRAPTATPLPAPSLPVASNVQAAPVRPETSAPAIERAAPVDPRWRVAVPGAASPTENQRQPWGGDVCRDLSNFRAWQAAGCRERGPPPRVEARGSPPAEIARPEPRRGRAPGATGEDQFAAQAAANEGWRDYTRGDGAYPGLRSLLKHH
ncbi:hypothetical protein ACO2Q1_15425 [Brevundimonas sp. VNH65]|uniref:hypothetical protein n=1 Tax=Brevundimonas sp. VNH65 TaxID=3400917 RepID=UPI003BFB5C13